MALFKSASKRSWVGPSEELVQEFHSTKSSPLGLSFHKKFDIYFVNLFDQRPDSERHVPRKNAKVLN